VKVQLVKSYCLPLLVYCIGALRLKRSTVQHLSVCWNDAFRKFFIISVLSQWRCYKYNLVYGFFSFVWLLQMKFFEFCVEKCYFWTLVSFFDHAGLEASLLCWSCTRLWFSSDCGSFRDCVVIVCNVFIVVFIFFYLFSCCIRCE